jgi:hypothetical protein
VRGIFCLFVLVVAGCSEANGPRVMESATSSRVAEKDARFSISTDIQNVGQNNKDYIWTALVDSHFDSELVAVLSVEIFSDSDPASKVIEHTVVVPPRGSRTVSGAVYYENPARKVSIRVQVIQVMIKS